MKVTLVQKTATLEEKNVAYVETTLHDGGYTYRAIFDKNTKKRFNAFCKSKGFIIGVVDDVSAVPSKTLEI